MAAAASRKVRFVDSHLRLFHAVAFDAQAVHGEAVARGDTAALPMPLAVVERGCRVEVVAAPTVHVTDVAMRDTWVSFLGETVGDFRSVALETRCRGGPRFADRRIRVTASARIVGAEGCDVILVTECVRATVHVGVTDRARRAAVQSQITVVAATA